MTRKHFVIASLLVLCACEQTNTKVAGVKGDEVARTCARAYGSTEAKITKIMKENGLTERPPMPSKEAFTAACSRLSLEAARCLDPVRAEADPQGCMAEMEKIPAEVKSEIEAVFMAAQAPPKPAEGEAAPAEGEAAPVEGEAAPAEGEAAPAEGAPAPQ